MLVLLAVSCRKDEIVNEPPAEPEQPAGTELPPEPEKPKEPAAVFPKTMQSLARVYIDTPGKVGITSKHVWIELCNIKILGDRDSVLFEKDSLKIKGRGNSTWYSYPKKPYSLKLMHQADFFGTGKSKRYVLLANWMDRTLLRNDVAFEAARRTSLEWTPSGRFVEFYLNGKHQGNYWLGERINVEGSKFEADYLFSFDTSDASETDFRTAYGFQPNYWQPGLPVEVKYPDRDDLSAEEFKAVLDQGATLLDQLGRAFRNRTYAGKVDLDSFCDWYLVHELTWNMEPNHPKSCFIHVRDGRFIAGPVWDFDWYTFVPGQQGLGISQSLFYSDLFGDNPFKTRLKERWKTLRPEFVSLGDYIDAQADRIRTSVETDKRLWPCWSTVNGDESLSFDAAIQRMKQAIALRIEELDRQMEKL